MARQQTHSMKVSKEQAAKMRPVGRVDEDSNAAVVDVLNHVLAAEYILFTKTLNYHWNVTGPRFFSIHSFLEDQYQELLKLMDQTAERVRILGDFPISTSERLSAEGHIPETEGGKFSTNEMLSDLFRSHLTLQKRIRHSLEDGVFEEDPSTEDFIIGILKHHEKMSWMIKSHLESGN